jgi:hypothetical protein
MCSVTNKNMEIEMRLHSLSKGKETLVLGTSDYTAK